MELRRAGTTLVVSLHGELDLVVADEFRRRVDAALEEWPSLRNLVLLMRDVSFVDSSGLGVILGRYRKIAARGGKVVLVRVQPQVRRLFEMAGMFKIMKVSDSEADALQMV